MRLPTGSAAQNAITAMTCLAEIYGVEGARLSSLDISKARSLPKPFVAKLLTILSQFGFVHGSPGPGGGYALAKPPSEISLYDVARIFERDDKNVSCPYGPDYCGHGPHCPLHHELLRFNEDMRKFMEKTTFDVFRSAARTKTARLRPTS